VKPESGEETPALPSRKMAENRRASADRVWWPWAVFGVCTLVLLLRPLFGFGALLPIDIAELYAPWRFDPQSGHSKLSNPLLSDTLDVHSHFSSMASDLRNGMWAFWDRSVGGGIPTMKAGLPVFHWVYLVVPAWYAPGLAAAFRTMTAAGLTFGLTRRIGLSRSAATISGVAFAFSGYLVGWSGWPQANVAALLPGVFWFAESVAHRPRPRQAVGFGLLLAAMVWANFPVVTVYGLVFGAGYALYRLWANRPTDRPGRKWRRAVIVAGWGVVLGCGLVSYHVAHFAQNLRWADTGPRERLPADTSIGAEFLPGVALPNPYGSTHDGGVFWGPGQNWVETQSYAGVAVIVLALLALAHRRPDRASQTTAMGGIVRAWWVIVIATLWISYVGGPLTEFVNSLPVVRYSTVGRARVIANLGLAVLAGLGFEAWLRGRETHPGVAFPQGIRRAALASLAGGIACAPFLWSWLQITREAGFVKETAEGMLVPLAFGCATAATLWFFFRRRLPSAVAVSLVTLLVAAELLVGLGSVATVVRTESVDLRTPSHQVAIDALQPGERMNAEGRVFLANSGQTVSLDDVRTNGFLPPGWREVFRAIDDDHFLPPGTVSNPYFAEVDIRSEALARLGVGVWAADPHTPAKGVRVVVAEGRDSIALDIDRDGAKAGVVPEAGLRAVTVDIIEPARGSIDVEIRAGGVVSFGSARVDDLTGPVDLVLVGEPFEPGRTFTTRFSFRADPMSGHEPVLRADAGRVSFGTVAGGDGWIVVHAGDVVLYDRIEDVGVRLSHAARDVERATVEDHLASRSVALVEPGIAATLGLPSEVPDGVTASATVLVADQDATVIAVKTTHPALVVVPNPDYPGWSVTVDGRKAEVVRVDDSFQGVLVPEGHSRVEFGFRPSFLGLTLSLTLLALLASAITWWAGGKLDERWRKSGLTG